MPSREPPPRAVLVAKARRLFESLARNHVSSAASGDHVYPHVVVAMWFDSWVEALGEAPDDLLEAHALRAIVQEALVEAQLRVTEGFAPRLGASRIAEMLRDFAKSIDFGRFAEARETSYVAWVSRVVRRPEPPAGIPTTDDEALRERVDRLTIEERSATTELELKSATGTLRDLSPLRDLPRLRRLVISDADLLVDLSPLGALTELEDLRIEGLRIVDLRPLEPLVRLRRLEVHMTSVSDLAPIGALRSLEDLQLYDEVTDIRPLTRLALRTLRLNHARCDLSPLGEMHALRDLRLAGSAQTSNVAVIGELVELRSLDLFELPFESIQPLSRLTALVELTLSSDRLRDIGAVAGLRALEKLDLSLSPVTDLTPLAGLPNLRVLQLFGTAIRSVPPVAELPRLEKLSLMCTPLDSLEGLQGARALRSLEIGPTTKIDDLSPLSGLEALEELDFGSQGALEDLGPLRGLRNLRTLRVDGANVSDLSPIAALANLEDAAFPRTAIESVEPLARLPTLRFVDVTQCHHLETLLPLAACPRLERIKCDDCEQLRGPKTVEAVRSWRPPRLAKTYPSAGLAAPRPGAVTVLDGRNHLPKHPPEGWTIPERSQGNPECYFIEADRARIMLALLAEDDHPHIVVAIVPDDRHKASDKLAARILRRFRACEAFVEMDDERGDALAAGVAYARSFAARAHQASPDTWGAVRRQQPRLRVEASDDKLAGNAGREGDVRNHLPEPLPEGWRVERIHEPEDVACRIVAPEGSTIVQLRLEEGGDLATLSVCILPPEDGAPYVGDDWARAWLERFRWRGAFEESSPGAEVRRRGGRMFVARVGG